MKEISEELFKKLKNLEKIVGVGINGKDIVVYVIEKDENTLKEIPNKFQDFNVIIKVTGEIKLQ
jgi:hypothetical protein